jgi:hypothetical protein
MLLDIYIVDEEGEEIKVEPSDVKITHSTLAIIISHTVRCVYVFKGEKVSIVQKFASARKASALRLQHGYKIKHVEETEGIDEDFIPILNHLGGLVDEEGVVAPAKEAPKPAEKPAEKPPAAPPKAALPKPAPVKKEPAVKKTTTTAKKAPAPKLTKIVSTMKSLEPPLDSSCDYIVAGTKLYVVLGDNKTDLRKGEFRLEEISTLPEGVFPAENYSPRILISNQRVIGVELWKNKK